MNWLLWDGDCGFCARVITLIEKLDGREQFRAIPYQSAPSPPMTPSLATACAQALHVVDSAGRIMAGGRACIFVIQKLGWRRTARVLRLPGIIFLVESAYATVARHRMLLSRLVGKPRACGVVESSQDSITESYDD